MTDTTQGALEVDAPIQVPQGARPCREDHMGKAAVLSDDGLYRYQLTRDWVFASGRLAFIMLNPSTADAETNDPTIRRCMKFAADLGYGGITVVNLYAYRATDPKDLFAAEKDGIDVVGPENLGYLYDVMEGAPYERNQPVIAAWGNNAPAAALEDLLTLPNQDRLHTLGVTKAGIPKHPLARGAHRIPDDAQPQPWTSPQT